MSESLFKKVASCRLINKRLRHKCFLVNFGKFSKQGRIQLFKEVSQTFSKLVSANVGNGKKIRSLKSRSGYLTLDLLFSLFVAFNHDKVLATVKVLVVKIVFPIFPIVEPRNLCFSNTYGVPKCKNRSLPSHLSFYRLRTKKDWFFKSLT